MELILILLVIYLTTVVAIVTGDIILSDEDVTCWEVASELEWPAYVPIVNTILLLFIVVLAVKYGIIDRYFKKK